MAIIIDTGVAAIAAIDLIRRSMLLINAISANEIPDDSDLNDAMVTLNEMFDSWSLQPMTLYRSPPESWVLTPGQSVYEWGVNAGPTGFNTDRPVRINNVTCDRDGVTTYVEVVSQQSYDNLSVKSISQPIPEQVLYTNSYPLGQLTFFPVPTEAVTINFDTDRLLEGPANLQSTLAFPPGYLRAIRYNLAVELWPEYANTTTDIESIKKIAKEALGKVKVANQSLTPASFTDVPGTEIGRSWDWRVG